MALQGAPERHDELRDRFETWLAARQDGAAVATVSSWADDVVWVDAGWGGEPHQLAVRRVLGAGLPQIEARCQYLTLRRLATQLNRPAVPSALWCEEDPRYLGAPFFVTKRVEGTSAGTDSWVAQASDGDLRRIEHALLDQVARVHSAAPSDFAFLDRRRAGESALAAHMRRTAAQYEALSSRGLRAPVIERAFGWLRGHWPVESVPVLCWGDARIGNAVFRDFTPVALQSWQHATFGPRELDLGSLIFDRRFADDLARAAGRRGLPDFLLPEDVASTYEEITGYQPVALPFYIVGAALGRALTLVRNPLRTNAFETLAALLDEAEEMTGET
jgi:aminoglycoside phosphotransferase (APT) family kinase protein